MSIILIITYNQKENINYRKEVKLRYDMGLVLLVCFLNFCALRLKTTYNPLRAHNLDRMDCFKGNICSITPCFDALSYLCEYLLGLSPCIMCVQYIGGGGVQYIGGIP